MKFTGLEPLINNDNIFIQYCANGLHFHCSRNITKKECKKLEAEHNIIAYDRESGQTKHPLGVILKAMHESAANAQLNSFYSSGRKS